VFAPFLDDYLSFVEGVEYLPVDLMAVWFSALGYRLIKSEPYSQ